jgi:hypothetical protein
MIYGQFTYHVIYETLCTKCSMKIPLFSFLGLRSLKKMYLSAKRTIGTFFYLFLRMIQVSKSKKTLTMNDNEYIFDLAFIG